MVSWDCPGTGLVGRRSILRAAASLPILALPLRAAIAQDVRYFTIGTGTAGGTYYPIGGLIANAVSAPPGSPPCEAGGSCGVPGLIATAQVTSGSIDNVRQLREGRLNSGLAQADVAYEAFRGEGEFEPDGPFTGLVAIARLFSEFVHIVVPRDVDIWSVADLEGRRVSIGTDGSGTQSNARAILRAAGIRSEWDGLVRLAPEPSGDRMLAGELDAFFLTGGSPLPIVLDMSRRIPLRLISFDDKEATDAMIEAAPFFTMGEIPRDTYPGVFGVRTFSVAAIWATTTDVPEDLAEAITRALWLPQTKATLEAGHPRGREIVLDAALTGLPIPVHPGAAKYYAELGMMPADRF